MFPLSRPVDMIKKFKMPYYSLLASHPSAGEPSGDCSNENEGFEWKQYSRKPVYCFSFKAAAVAFLFILQLGFILHFYEEASRCHKTESDHTQTFKARFESDQGYQSLDHRYDSLWNETEQSPIIMTSIGLEDGQAQVGSITMFHQLHCLTSIRKALQESREGKDIGVDSKDNAHWPHCLDYLRKAILCYGDDTIERAEPSHNEAGPKVISGFQDLRTCYDTSHIYTLRSESYCSTTC